jgi:hypothetical protein
LKTDRRKRTEDRRQSSPHGYPQESCGTQNS